MPARTPTLPTLAVVTLLLLSSVGCVNAPPATRHARQDAIRFESRSGVAKANGIFHDWRVVDARIDPADLPGSHVVIEIDVASLDTGFPRRDAHLQAAEFFDVAQWPKARVRVSGASPVDEAATSYDARFVVAVRDREATVSGTFRLVAERPRVVEGEVLLDRAALGVGEPDQWWNPMSPRDEVPVRFRLTLD